MNPEDLEQKIEDYRQRFRDAPIGTWRTDEGTFNIVVQDYITYFPNGTGEEVRQSAFSGETKLSFKWRRKGLQTIEMSLPCESNVKEFDEIEEDIFCKLHYDFKVFKNGFGTESIGIYEVGKDGFFFQSCPLTFVETL